MKANFSLLRIVTLVMVILFLFVGLTYLDQTTQATIVTSQAAFKAKNSAIDEKDLIHLKHLGFSDIAITHMTPEEVNGFKRISGKVVDQHTVYRKVTDYKDKRMSRKNYEKLLSSYKDSYFPDPAILEKVTTKLIDEGNRVFLAISEHHFDYIPTASKPMGIELQLRPEYPLIDYWAREIWWTAPSFNSEKITDRTEEVNATVKEQENKDSELFEEEFRPSSVYYNVPFKQPGLSADVVGMHFVTATQFEVPKDFLFADMYIQGTNPHLSDALQFRIGP